MLRLIYIFLIGAVFALQVDAEEVAVSRVLIPLSGTVTVGGAAQVDATEILSAGEIAIEDGFGAVAEKSFRNVLELQPHSGCSTGAVAVSVRANEGLLQALLLQEKYGELLAQVDVFVEAGSMGMDVAAYWRALVLSRESNYTEAVAILVPFRGDLSQCKIGVDMLRLLALVHLKSGSVTEAIDDFKLFDELFPESDELIVNRLDWGKALIFQGEFKNAVEVLEPAITNSDIHFENDARYWTGKAYLQLEETQKGLNVLEPLLAGESVAEDLRVNAVLAVVNSRNQGVVSGDGENRHKNDSDIELLTNTLLRVSSAESKRKISFEISRIFLDSGRVDEAAPMVKAYISDNSDTVTSAALQLKMGDALLDVDRYAEAVVIYQQYLEIFVNAGGHAHAQLGRGWALMGVERYAEAALAFEKAYDLFNESEQKMECLFKIGDAFFANTQYKKAITIYDRFRKEFPESKYQAKALFQSGICQELLEQYDVAELTFESVAKMYSDSVEAKESFLRIGALYELQGEWKVAEDLYARMMKLYPSGSFFAKALRGRGVARYQQWSPDALADFERLVKEFPDSEDAEYAFFMRAMCLYRLGRDSQAFELCEEFMSCHKDSLLAPVVRFWLGKFAYNSGDFKSAESEFLAFIEEYPQHELADDAVFRAGMTAVKRKEYLHAIELFGVLVKDFPESSYLAEARFNQGDAMSHLGKFSGAILVFDEIINNFSTSGLVPMAWGRKGDCQFALGAGDAKRYKEAIRSYRVVTQSPQVRWDRILQAEYKIALSLEKSDQREDALDHYYSKVMVPFLLEREKGSVVAESAKVWFTRGALAAADIVTDKNDWRQLVRILNRIVEADVAVSADAKKRIKGIESNKWWLFY